jgi:hypothetical protein
VIENGLEGAAARTPPAAAAGSVVARRRRRRAIIGGELAFVPSPKECVPHRIVIRVEARVSALLVAHALEDLVEGGVGIGTPSAPRRQPPGAWKLGGAG